MTMVNRYHHMVPRRINGYHYFRILQRKDMRSSLWRGTRCLKKQSGDHMYVTRSVSRWFQRLTKRDRLATDVAHRKYLAVEGHLAKLAWKKVWTVYTPNNEQMLGGVVYPLAISRR
jgi:hypothetical protein